MAPQGEQGHTNAKGNSVAGGACRTAADLRFPLSQ